MDQKVIKVSVICLAYNEEEYIRQALDSLVSQKTNFKFEILCHDDCSTDRTAEIIHEYERSYPEIVRGIYQTENKYQKGEQIIFKYIYPLACGKYIAYCDCDDYWTDVNKLQKQVDFLDSHSNYGMCVHAFDCMYEKSGRIEIRRYSNIDCDISIASVIRWNSKKVPQIGTALFRKDLAVNRPELFRKIGGGAMSERFISDHPLYIYVALNSKIRYLNDNMSCWRRRIDGTWGKGTPKPKLLNHQIATRDFFDKLDKYTNYLYHEDCQYEIDQSRMKSELINGNYRAVIKNKTFRSSYSMKMKMVILVGCISPILADWIQRTYHKRIE